MAVSVAATWTAAYNVASGYIFPFPAARPVQVSVANTPGDWLFCVVTWRQERAGAGVSISVADDAHNWWEPLGAPSGDSSAAGVVRCAIWVAPAARAAGSVQIAATGPYVSLGAVIYDVAGLAPWLSVSAVSTNQALAATSLTVSTGAPSGQILLFSAVSGDNLADGITGPGAGWSSPAIVTRSNGVDHSADIQLLSVWQVTSSAVTSTWSSSGAQDLAGIMAGVLVSAAAPSQPNPMWPVTITEVAIGSGAQTPPSQLSWTALSPRSLAMQVQQGRQYTLSQLQAGQGQMTLDNPDGALIPPGSGSFAGIDSGTPVRQRVIWTGGAWQVQLSGNGTTANPGIVSTASGTSAFPVVPFGAYPVSAWLLCPQGWASGVSAGVNWYGSGGGFLSSSGTAAIALPAGQVVLAAGTVFAPAGAAFAQPFISALGTPPASAVFTAAAAPPQAGTLTPAGITWTGANGATVTTLAAWKEDPRGAPNPSPHYVAYSGFLKRWPFAVPGDMLRGETAAELTDIWGYAAGALNSMAREECLVDSPYALWPADDPAGSSGASNLAPGNSNPLTLVASKYGTSGATATFGANSGALIGDTSAKTTVSSKAGASGMFSQVLSGSSLNTSGLGYALACTDTDYPSVTGGVTIEAWFQCLANQATGGNQAFTVGAGGHFNTAGSSFPNGTPVVLSVAAGFTFPAPFTAGTVYYVINSSGGNYDLAATVGGSAIAVTGSGAGFITGATPWNAVVLSARNIKGLVAEIDIRTSDGALLLLYKTAAGTQNTVVIDSSHDYRFAGITHVSVAFNRSSYQVIVNGGSNANVSGSFSASLPARFDELTLGGIQDRGFQGGTLYGYLAFAAVYPLMLTQSRVLNHFTGGGAAMLDEAACDRVERILEYGGLTGRRWLGQQQILYAGDLTVSGRDIGGQAAASCASSIAASTVPALLYVAPTGDIVYWSKLYTWNQPVKWTLGDNVAGGEIPFRIGSFATDYDPARVVNDVQITQLDTQTITVPSGVMASTTVAAVSTASEAQYGDQTWQVTGYLTFDATSAYNQGGSLVDLANWVASVYSKPRNRVQAVTVEAASHPSAWPFWAGASVGDMVQANVRLPTTAASPLISLVARITQTQRSMQFSQSGTSAAISCVLDFAPEYQALICDDPVRGLLNGQNVLSW